MVEAGKREREREIAVWRKRENGAEIAEGRGREVPPAKGHDFFGFPHFTSEEGNEVRGVWGEGGTTAGVACLEPSDRSNLFSSLSLHTHTSHTLISPCCCCCCCVSCKTS